HVYFSSRRIPRLPEKFPRSGSQASSATVARSSAELASSPPSQLYSTLAYVVLLPSAPRKSSAHCKTGQKPHSCQHSSRARKVLAHVPLHVELRPGCLNLFLQFLSPLMKLVPLLNCLQCKIGDWLNAHTRLLTSDCSHNLSSFNTCIVLFGISSFIWNSRIAMYAQIPPTIPHNTAIAKKPMHHRYGFSGMSATITPTNPTENSMYAVSRNSIPTTASGAAAFNMAIFSPSSVRSIVIRVSRNSLSSSFVSERMLPTVLPPSIPLFKCLASVFMMPVTSRPSVQFPPEMRCPQSRPAPPAGIVPSHTMHFLARVFPDSLLLVLLSNSHPPYTLAPSREGLSTIAKLLQASVLLPLHNAPEPSPSRAFANALHWSPLESALKPEQEAPPHYSRSNSNSPSLGV